MPDEKAPSSGAFLPASLMYFCSGEPMHFLSGVDTVEWLIGAPAGMSLNPENSSTGWPSFGERFKSTRDSTHRWMKEGAQVTYDDIVDHCCYAWNTLVDGPWKIMSIGLRQWADGF